MLLGISVCCLCILLHSCSAYTIPQCGSDGKFEISDTTEEVSISCTGTGDDPVYLSISRSDGTTKTIASCPTKVCNNDPDFRVTREDDAIHAVKKGNVQSRDTLAGTLKCGRLGSASPAASCELRVVSYTIPQCGSDGKFEISDTTEEVSISCTGTGDDPVYLSISRSDGTTKTIASCPTKVCNNDPDFRVTREDDAIHAVKKGYVQSRDTLAGTLKCGRLGSASPAASCELRVVYVPEVVENCIAEVNEDWTVSGSCQVNKMFASDGHYGCSWLRIPQGGHSTRFSGQMEVTSTFTENGKTYHRGLCSFAGHAMPTTAGHYGYAVTIDPGHEFFPGTGIDIKPPEGDPYVSHCPAQLVEGDTLNCTCHVSSSNPGVPPAVVSWAAPPEILNSLVLHSVTRSQDGRIFTCRQYWGGYDTSIGQEATYTLHVNYPPPSPPVITGLGTTFIAGDSLSLTCTVSGGKPGVSSVFFYCGRHSDNPDERQKLGREEIVFSSLKIQSLSASENNSVCYCSAKWDTRPSLYRKTARAEIILSAPGGIVLPASTAEVTTEKATLLDKNSDDSDTTEATIITGVTGGPVLPPASTAEVTTEKATPPTTDKNSNDSDDSDDTEQAMMIGVTGGVGGIAAAAIIALVVVVLKQRRNSGPPLNRPPPDPDNSSYDLVNDAAGPVHNRNSHPPDPDYSNSNSNSDYANTGRGIYETPSNQAGPVHNRNSHPPDPDYSNSNSDYANTGRGIYETPSNQDPVAWPYQSLELQPLPSRSSSIQQDQYVDATSSIQQSPPTGSDYANTEGNQALPTSGYYENTVAK